mmetsp:Transcript_1788/g.3921  ORF Transcript_1788/g.3921 Transcript_1788/m.3921 type:complete len:271 (+) Transcript_1788:3187-3999(+)
MIPAAQSRRRNVFLDRGESFRVVVRLGSVVVRLARCVSANPDEKKSCRPPDRSCGIPNVASTRVVSTDGVGIPARSCRQRGMSVRREASPPCWFCFGRECIPWMYRFGYHPRCDRPRIARRIGELSIPRWSSNREGTCFAVWGRRRRCLLPLFPTSLHSAGSARSEMDRSAKLPRMALSATSSKQSDWYCFSFSFSHRLWSSFWFQWNHRHSTYRWLVPHRIFLALGDDSFETMPVDPKSLAGYRSRPSFHRSSRRSHCQRPMRSGWLRT